MAVINVEDAYILDETGEQVDKVTGLFTKDEGTTEEEKEFAQLNIGASGGGGGRNLLDNAWFWSGTVNQRGATGATYGAFGYDRWKGVSVGYTINSDGSISVFGTAVQVWPDRGIAGEEYTVSVKYVDGTIESGTAIYTSNKQFIFSGGNITVYPSANQMNVGATSKNIRAIKLELGSVSTIANDAPPIYAEELAKCKYYYRRIANQAGAGVWGLTNGLCVLPTAADFVIEGEMNKNTGSSAYSGSLQVNGQAVTGMTMFSRGIDDKSLQVTLRFGVGSGLTQYGGAGLLIGAGGYIEISHDI